MSQRIVVGVPNDRVATFCRVQRAAGATVCEATPAGDNKSDVLVAFPANEGFDEHTARTGK